MLNRLRLKSILRSHIILILGTTLILGCTVKKTVPVKTPVMIVDKKIPLNLVLVISQSIRQHECYGFIPGYPLFGDAWVYPSVSKLHHNCGECLSQNCRETMKQIFVTVQQVRDISEAIEPWDRALWLEVDDFDISGYSGFLLFATTPKIWINLKYKLTDKNNKTLFSSNISLERKDELAIVPYTEMTSEFLEQVMLKMVEEIMDAHNKGQV